MNYVLRELCDSVSQAVSMVLPILREAYYLELQPLV